MKIKFELVSTQGFSGRGGGSFNFEVNSFKEFQDEIAKHWSGGEEIEGFAYAVLDKYKDASKTFAFCVAACCEACPTPTIVLKASLENICGSV